LCFVCLTANNLLLFIEVIVLPTIDLRVPRNLTALAGMMFLLYGFIRDSE